METKDFLNVFRSLSHPRFDIKEFRKFFIKAAWKAYTDIEHTPISQIRFQNLFLPLFDSLFLKPNQKFETILHDVHELLLEKNRVEQFFSNTFYIVLNHYIKSFYGTIGGWEKISPFASAIERFIAHVAQRLDDESYFILEDALINALEMLRQRSQSITVLNTYYGVPIQFPAHIIHTDAQSVVLRVHPLQETAALLQKGIYLLKNTHFIHDVYASVNPVIVEGERLLELSRFDKLEGSLFHRQSIRVHPHKPYKFTIIHPSLTLEANVYDVSIGGISVTSKSFYSLSPFVDVILLLPSEIMGQECEVHGQLVFKSTYEGGYKYHFKITPTLQQEGSLSKYIARREQDIIKKLREEIP